MPAADVAAHNDALVGSIDVVDEFGTRSDRAQSCAHGLSRDRFF
jgi:hypothetical protein